MVRAARRYSRPEFRVRRLEQKKRRSIPVDRNRRISLNFELMLPEDYPLSRESTTCGAELACARAAVPACIKI